MQFYAVNQTFKKSTKETFSPGVSRWVPDQREQI